jgi:hypothetical protein
MAPGKLCQLSDWCRGDVVKLSLGGVVAADVRLTSGEILLDQSMLTGESIPIEAGVRIETYAGALVRRGEAVAEVSATGARTKFGRTAELVRTAHVVSSQQKAVLRVVRNLALFAAELAGAASRTRLRLSPGPDPLTVTPPLGPFALAQICEYSRSGVMHIHRVPPVHQCPTEKFPGIGRSFNGSPSLSRRGQPSRAAKARKTRRFRPRFDGPLRVPKAPG